MSWWQAIDELALATVWFVVPGLSIALAIGLRGLWGFLAAPALSTALLGGWPVVLAWAGIPWRPLTAALAVVFSAGVLWFAARPLRRGSAGHGFGGPDLWTLAGVAAGAVLVGTVLCKGIGAPDVPAQTWDAVFHLNAARYAVETGNASSFQLGVIGNTAAGHGFYPGAWHSVVALSTTGSVVVAANAVTLVMSALVWPLGLAALARAVMPRWPEAGLAVPVAGAAFVAFPATMVSWGTLWPNALSYALVPVALALTAVAVRAPGGLPDGAVHLPSRVPAGIAVLVALVGIGLAQPNGTLTYAVLATPLVVGSWWRSVRGSARHRVLAATGALLAWGGIWTGAWFVFARSIGVYQRDRVGSFGAAVVTALGDGPVGTTGTGGSWSVALAVLTVVGAVALLISRQGRWLVVSAGISLALFGLGADTTLGARDLLRPWYADIVRLGGAVPLTGAALVGAGVIGSAHLAVGLLRGSRVGARRPVAGVLSVGLVAALVLATGLLRADARRAAVAAAYESPVVAAAPHILTSEQELRLLERLGDELPDDARILGDPFTGSALAYAVAGVDVVFPHVRGVWADDAAYLGQHLGEIDTDPEVCRAIERLGVDYLYLDSDVYFPGHPAHELYKGIGSEPPSEGFRLVDQGGTARVYEVGRCG